MNVDNTARREPLTYARNVLFYGFLLILSLLFFSLVRNNSFWNSADYLLLGQALDIGHDWRQTFAAAQHQPFEPLVKLVFYLEYSLFGVTAWNYYLFNIVIHSINAFLVFFLVLTLLKERTIAVLSSALFACAVGNYGKAVMVVSGVGDLLITMLTLLTLLFYFKNELQKGGRTLSFWFLASTFCFALSLMTKATSFSILGCMLAFNFFFRPETKKPVFHRGFVIITIVAAIALIVKFSFFPDFVSDQVRQISFGPSFFRNFGSYLVRMVFPIHASRLVSGAGPVVEFVYQLATEIRVLTFLIILSYSVFGFLFGNRAIRFFIVWTYITVLPFCFFKFPNDWLNIRYLYLVSVGFIMILASGTVLAARLLYQRAWRRFLPYAMPLFFVLLSQFIVSHLDGNYERMSASPTIEQLRDQFMARHAEAEGEGR